MGLALGMAISIMIFIIVNNHLNYDKHFSKADNIYRINIETSFEEQESNSVKTPLPLAKTLLKYSREIKNSARILKGSHKLVSYRDKHYTASNFYYSDESFLDIFDIEIVKGDSINPLKDSASIIITEKIANQYFGKENPLGKVLNLDNGWDFTVTAVCKEFPAKSHFKFAFLADLKKAIQQTELKLQKAPEHVQWQNDIAVTYFLLNENGKIENIKNDFDKIIKSEIVPHLEDFVGMNLEEYNSHNNYYKFAAQSILDIHTGESYEGEFESTYPKFYITVFVSIALVILILACINFMNLTTARSSTRSIEIGLRKISGATRKQLISQFLIESIILSAISLIFAVAIIEIIYGLNNDSSTFSHNASNLPYVLIFTIVVGIFAGAYPAFYLSQVKVISTLQGKLKIGIKSIKMRRAFVLVQLSITFIILISQGVIMQQIDYFNEKNLSFEKDELHIVKRAYTLDSLKTKFRNEITQNNNIIDATYINALPGDDEIMMIPLVMANDTSKIKYVSELRISENFISTFEIETLQKLDSTKCYSTKKQSIIINESAAKLFNIKELTDSIYLDYYLNTKKKWHFHVTAIVKDFHYQTFYNKIKPMVLIHSSDKSYFKYLAIRVKKNNSAESIRFINNHWNNYVPDNIFEHFPLKSQMISLHKKEHNTAVLFVLFSILAVLIATMGIFGLTSFTVHKRTREIGIRKALGTPTYRIVYLLSYEFIKWLIVSFLVASPLAYFIMKAWLSRFVYHVDIDFTIFIQVGVFMFVITIVTVVLHALRATYKNPAVSLKYE